MGDAAYASLLRFAHFPHSAPEAQPVSKAVLLANQAHARCVRFHPDRDHPDSVDMLGSDAVANAGPRPGLDAHQHSNATGGTGGPSNGQPADKGVNHWNSAKRSERTHTL
jgi:hypothetical protein